MTPLTWVLIAGLLIIVTYELIAAIRNKTPTISEYVWILSAKNPIVPFLFGLLMGHLFA